MMVEKEREQQLWGLGLEYEGDGDDIICWEVCWREGVGVGLGFLFWVFFYLLP